MPNFVVTSLPAYVQENRDILLKNFGLLGTGTRRRIGIQTGIKKQAALNYLEVTPTLQDGNVCEFTPLGDVEISQRVINVADIKVNLEICAKTLVGKYAEYLVRINGNEQNDLPFERFVIDGVVAEINKKIENLIWQGDTTSANPDLKWIDGLLKQFAADTDIVTEAIATGTPIYDACVAVYMKMTDYAIERGGIIFVSPANYRTFVQEMVAKNYYHYTGPQNAAPEEFILPGTNVAIVPAAGLSGDNAHLVGTFGDNLVYGTDMENDAEDIKVGHDDKNDSFYVKANWASGIAYRFPEHIVLGTIA